MRSMGVEALCFTIAIIACSEDKAIVNNSSDDVDNSAAKMTISEIKAGGGGRRPNLDGGGTRELVSSTGDTKGLTVSNVRAGGYRGKTPNRNPFLARIGDQSVAE